MSGRPYISISEVTQKTLDGKDTSFRWLLVKTSPYTITETRCTRTREEAEKVAKEWNPDGRFKVIWD